MCIELVLVGSWLMAFEKIEVDLKVWGQVLLLVVVVLGSRLLLWGWFSLFLVTRTSEWKRVDLRTYGCYNLEVSFHYSLDCSIDSLNY